MSKRGRTLNSQARELVVKLHEYFERESQNGGLLLPVTQVRDRVGEALGIGSRTVGKILSEKYGPLGSDSNVLHTPKKRKRNKPVTGIDEFDSHAIRNHIYGYFTRGEFPTLAKLCATLKDAGLYKGSIESLRTVEMFQFQIPGKQYYLSLDNLDFSFLSQYVQKPIDDRKPLWSKPVDEESAYYQVEIVSEDILDEDAFIEPCKSYHCYICNVDVPHQYCLQHNRSTNHQNYKKLTEKILDNVANQINIEIEISNNSGNNTFYCEICCKVVAVKHKSSHKKSTYHLKCIENEKLTAKFLEMYISSEKRTENYIEPESKYENGVSPEYTSMSDTDSYNAYDSENEDIENDLNNIDVSRATEIKSKNESVDDKFQNFKIYLEDVIEKYNKNYNMAIVENNSIVIVTPKGHKEQITIDTFHGYKRMGCFVFCLLCLTWVDNKTEHGLSTKHASSVVQPVNDVFARKLDHQYSHCLLCNDRIVTESDHADVTLVHKKYQQPPASASKDLKNDRLLDKITTPTLKTAKETPLSKENVEYTTSKTSKAAPLSFENIDVVTIGRKLIEYKKHLSYLTPTEMNCLICAVNVPNTTSNIITHVEGHLHTTACENLLQKNKVEKISFGLYHCRVCNDYTKNFMTHITTHNKKKPSVGRDFIKKQELRKYIYEDPMNNSPIAVRYRQIYKESLEGNKIISRGESTFYCKVCLIKLTRISEIDHMFGERHRFNLNLKSS